MKPITNSSLSERGATRYSNQPRRNRDRDCDRDRDRDMTRCPRPVDQQAR